MATTSEITSSTPSSISSNPTITTTTIDHNIETINNKNVSSSSSSFLSNNSTKNGVGSAAKGKRLIRDVLDFIKLKGRIPQQQQPTNNTADEDTPPTTTTNNTRSSAATTTTTTTNDALRNLINAELNFINNASEILKKNETNIKEVPNSLKETESHVKLHELKKSVMKLKQQITSKSKDEYDQNRNSWTEALHKVDQIEAQKLLEEMPHLYMKKTTTSSSSSDQNDKSTFEKSFAFREFELLYNSLSIELKLCLLCFSVFPELVTIKKRIMIYWWIAEGFVPPMMIPIIGPKTREETAIPKNEEEYANGFFDELMAKGFIEPVYEKHSFMVDSCKMHPFVRSAIIVLAERAKFFDFDQYGQLKADPRVDGKDGQPPRVEFFGSLRACLLGSGFRENEDFEKLHMVFNVNEKILELKSDWLSRMKNVNILYLGRWQTSATHHIEVEGTEFLDGLKKMSHLRFLSLQGISRITELPESISNLTNLTILDLRACHNLDTIPEGIGSLKSLIHLDMSECYLLDHLPKSLKSLHQLQVLKGFVVGDSKPKSSCTLEDLAGLRNLRKLSIYTGVEQFPRATELKALNRMQMLIKLTIAWGRGSTKPDTQKAETATLTGTKSLVRPLIRSSAVHQDLTSAYGVSELPSRLQKLDLQCFPRINAPNWLKPGLLKELEKLYIRGGKLCDLRQLEELDDESPENDKWLVKILRLKYLTELEMNWRELCEFFPNLIYVEKVKCPKLTFFPCNETGVWMKKGKCKQFLGTVL